MSGGKSNQDFQKGVPEHTSFSGPLNNGSKLGAAWTTPKGSADRVPPTGEGHEPV